MAPIDLNALLATSAASALFVGLKSIQQLNVSHAKYRWILPTSLLMAVVEIYVVAQVATRGYGLWLILAVGAGSGIGATAATWLHGRLRK
jgi:hypothetical protein